MANSARTTLEGHDIALTHLDKVLWPEAGWTKGEALHYYAVTGPLMLPHLAGRPASFVRFPSGVGGPTFFTKHPHAGTPEWVTTVPVASSRGPDQLYVSITSMAELIYMANHYALEIHVPQWTAPRADVHDRLVVDLDPGPGRGVADCARLAVLARELLAADGLTAWVKTSGSKGLHLSVPLVPTAAEAVIGYAKSLAENLEGGIPQLAVSRMAKELRGGRVFVDWSQNSGKKTTAAPYTLRARAHPTVSAPVGWDEVERFDEGALEFTAPQVLERLAQRGDLWADLADPGSRCRLPS